MGVRRFDQGAPPGIAAGAAVSPAHVRKSAHVVGVPQVAATGYAGAR